jgi:4-amino-4-deoxy-L-arabinose transferase-like glycosyltransferase
MSHPPVDESCTHHSTTPPLITHAAPGRRSTLAILIAVLTIGAALRVYRLDQAPPGLHQDEASNAWNAWCLLKTGQDQAGERWPLFCTRAFGEYRSALFLYAILPFQAVGGLGVWTTRLPSVFCGLGAVALIAYVGARLFGRPVGLVAAAFLAVSPWAIQQSRWGHEVVATPLLMLAPLALWLWARLPLSDDREEAPPSGPGLHRSLALTAKPRITRAALAGAAAGLACYGYPTVRIVLPLLLGLTVIFTARTWLRLLRTPRGAAAVIALGAGWSALFGPLAWQHLAHPERIGRRGEMTGSWNPDEPLANRISAMARLYPAHYESGFLFLEGDRNPVRSLPERGQLPLYLLPLLLAGAVVLARTVDRSRAARVLLIWLLVWPAADCFADFGAPHALRSLPGLPALMLLGALGAVRAGAWIGRRSRLALAAAATLMGAAVIHSTIQFARLYLGEHCREPGLFVEFHADLLEASRWLKPRLNDVDAVFCTVEGPQMPYAVMLVGLDYDPEQWFRDARNFVQRDVWEACQRFGKMHFDYQGYLEWVRRALARNGRADRVVWIVRPGEHGLEHPDLEIRGPDGRPTLWICQRTY